MRERLAGYVSAVLPSVLVHLVATHAAFAFDGAAFALLCSCPWAARSRRDLRTFVLRTLLSTAVAASFALASPLVPWLPAVWLLIVADAWSSRAPRARPLLLGLAIVAGAGRMAAGRAALAEVLAGFLVYAVVANARRVWDGLRHVVEWVANSWREVRLGPVRIINHGAWAGLATFLCVFIAGALTGPGHVAAILVASLASMVCSALWAQVIEGSPALSRPYGFYGGLLGICAGALAAPLLGTQVWLLLGALAVAGPFVQATGRLRCLVQGCCHGRQAPPSVGIRYVHPNSRVCRLAKLRDVPVHPTQLYSILLERRDRGRPRPPLAAPRRRSSDRRPVSAVERAGAFRGGVVPWRAADDDRRRPSSVPVVALGCVFVGALVTALGTSPEAPTPVVAAPSVLAGVAFGVLTWFATGVDFPESNRRFSRLT